MVGMEFSNNYPSMGLFSALAAGNYYFANSGFNDDVVSQAKKT